MSENVLQQVQRLYKIKIRSENDGKERTNFLERMASYGGTRVRRVLMPKLLKNSPQTVDANGKKRKRPKPVFDPTIHVKKEPELCTEKDTMLEHVLEDPDELQRDLSSLTLPIEADIEIRTRALICEDIEKMYSTGDKNPTLHEILGIVKNAKEQTHEEPEPDALSGIMVLPSLEKGKELKMPTICTDTLQDDMPLQVPNRFTPLDKGVSKLKCHNDCTFEYQMIDSHEDVLDEIFGNGMHCVGCKKSLYSCMARGLNRGAFICVHCEKKNCRQMHCNSCYILNIEDQNNNNKRTTRRKRCA